jgi:hypothetical protein
MNDQTVWSTRTDPPLSVSDNAPLAVDRRKLLITLAAGLAATTTAGIAFGAPWIGDCREVRQETFE